ncbi:hypothetical protein ACAG26_24145 [Mycobacterium sp. pUA109]|uniref:hypothetical protein n=1 Tax=Mycobacterium sp. pUA109 TaxID=3238982 RepID=UPI00351AE411
MGDFKKRAESWELLLEQGFVNKGLTTANTASPPSDAVRRDESALRRYIGALLGEIFRLKNAVRVPCPRHRVDACFRCGAPIYPAAVEVLRALGPMVSTPDAAVGAVMCTACVSVLEAASR